MTAGISPAVADSNAEARALFGHIEKVAPGLISESVENGSVSTSTVDAKAITVTAVGVGSSGASGSGISLTVEGVTVASSGDPALRTFLDSSGNQGVVQELANGFRVVRSIASGSDAKEFEYQLGVSSNVSLDPMAGGFLIVSEDGVHGFLSEPWAFDVKGDRQPTHFEVNGSQLRQVVEPHANASYPIVADPQWGYAYTYTTRSSPNTNWLKINNCFNCFFPVKGAPVSYPAPNQLLPLKAAVPVIGDINMECRMGTTVIGVQNFSWSFRATANHYDGYGSYISFNFKYINNVPSLVVTATIAIDRGMYLNAVNSGAAQANWQEFVNRLNA